MFAVDLLHEILGDRFINGSSFVSIEQIPRIVISHRYPFYRGGVQYPPRDGPTVAFTILSEVRIPRLDVIMMPAHCSEIRRSIPERRSAHAACDRVLDSQNAGAGIAKRPAREMDYARHLVAGKYALAALSDL